MTLFNYLIYGKGPEMTVARPLSGNSFAVNLIHAEFFETKEQADKLCKYLNDNNPKYTWEVRKAKK